MRGQLLQQPLRLRPIQLLVGIFSLVCAAPASSFVATVPPPCSRSRTQRIEPFCPAFMLRRAASATPRRRIQLRPGGANGPARPAVLPPTRSHLTTRSALFPGNAILEASGRTSFGGIPRRTRTGETRLWFSVVPKPSGVSETEFGENADEALFSDRAGRSGRSDATTARTANDAGMEESNGARIAKSHTASRITHPALEEKAEKERAPQNAHDERDHAMGNEDAICDGLKSRPVANGKWDPRDPVGWAKSFGSRGESKWQYYEDITRLRPGDEGYFDVSNVTCKSVTIVRTKEQARVVMRALMSAEARSVFHACDTEVMDIDLKSEGPVGNGYVTCASVYSGPHFDYGLGDGPGSTLWIDNLDDAAGVLQEFKEWFESEDYLKVWHNYGFDRHVMWNEGIDCRGFGGDTMHMARLQDTGRAKYGSGTGYSLEALTADILNRRKLPMKEIFGVPRLRKDGTEGSLIDVPSIEVLQRDPRYRTKFIMYSAYDAEGTWYLREELQKMLEKLPWVKVDETRYNLYYYYQKYLREFGEVLTDMERRGIRVDAKDYLANVEVQARKDREHHVSTFREWATFITGPDGLAINPASALQIQTFLFGGAINQKTKEPTEAVRTFKVLREEVPDEAIRAFVDREKQEKESMKESESVSLENEKDAFDLMTAVQLKELCREKGLKISGKKIELQQRLRGHFLLGEENATAPQDDFDSMTVADLRHACVARGLSDKGTKAVLLKRIRDDCAFALELLSASPPESAAGYKSISEALADAASRDGGKLSEIMKCLEEKASAPSKYVDVTLTSIQMKPEKFTAGGAPSVTADVLRDLAGDPLAEEPKYGRAYNFFGGGKAGHDACVALYSLTAIGSIDTMIANFLTSLQSLADEQSRVHCSLNFNTETGRLSSRRPNLQNQPALEKDTYKIRQAFQSSPGNNLIVADYGQLELRLLASMTNCTSMIDAFREGGDFHSRTAMGMFPYIQKKVDDGEILFEWDYSKGDPPKPLVKDEYASERRKAKTLNFSIAYGKTAHGLSKDWDVSVTEAEEMLNAWYKSRPEVLKWQKAVKNIAREKGETRTLMGRYRRLPDAMPGSKRSSRKLLGHAERASINTPIQGGAADVVMMAMIKINDSELLKRLGWILLMQIHDEVILEGPEETAEEAFEEVIRCMENPWVFGLEKTAVPLTVDGSFTHKNWYEAK